MMSNCQLLPPYHGSEFQVAFYATMSSLLLSIPKEIILHIFSYLDIPDLQSIGQIPRFTYLASDPVLHMNRIRVITPCRIRHFLFGQSPQGTALRPTIYQLVDRNIFRGLSVERRLRTGSYIYTERSIRQFEIGNKLQRQHASIAISVTLQRRQSPANDSLIFRSLHLAHVLPDEETSTLSISRNLLPVMRQLKWSFQRDKLAKMVRSRTFYGGSAGFGHWVEEMGKGIVQDCERVRLALCPDVKRSILLYEARCK